jgi:ABC-type antimicrobial peptide transport system permease subunit
MILKNLLRRKARTFLTILGIGVGVAAIVILGALANGLGIGYDAMLSGSKADLVLSQPDSFDISFSSIDESIGKLIINMPEVKNVSGMLEGFTQAEDNPFFFVFGYPEDSFVLDRFQIIEGVRLGDRKAQLQRGNPLILGSAVAEVMDKDVGDTLRIASGVFRVVGIFQTGDAFEDSSAVMRLEDAQEVLGKLRQVSIFYIQLKEPDMRERFITRIERQLSNLMISGVDEFAEKQTFDDMMQGYIWVIGGLAIVIGGVGMTNSQLMSVFERTREIGVLRAVGWSSRRILWLILGESLWVCLGGGAMGISIGYFVLHYISQNSTILGLGTSMITTGLLGRAIGVVLLLGVIGGLYPAWRASRLTPVEALRYEGGSAGKNIRRLPIGGMAVQSLWQRTTRTLLTISAIGITVGAIMALEGMVRGAFGTMEGLFGEQAEVMIRQADISDTSVSAVDERVGDTLTAMSEVRSVSGMIFTAVMLPESSGFFILFGYNPNEFAIQNINLIEGERLTTNHQMILGKRMAETLNKQVGDTINLSGSRYRVVGIYESNVAWEELGGIITLRDAQLLMGRPHKVTIYMVKLNHPLEAVPLVEKINLQFPEVHAAISGEFIDQMPDMETTQAMMDSISFIAILVGGISVLNTMLMAVIERTREIGVLRALGWRRRAILKIIMNEALLLGLLGGVVGILIAFGMAYLMARAPMVGDVLDVVWEWDIFARALGIALFLGVFGGLYPAYRATKLQPVEALRYE